MGVGLGQNKMLLDAYCVIFLDNISFRDESVNTGKKIAACVLRSAGVLHLMLSVSVLAHQEKQLIAFHFSLSHLRGISCSWRSPWVTCWGESMWKEPSAVVWRGMLTLVPQDDQAEAAASIPTAAPAPKGWERLRYIFESTWMFCCFGFFLINEEKQKVGTFQNLKIYHPVACAVFSDVTYPDFYRRRCSDKPCWWSRHLLVLSMWYFCSLKLSCCQWSS